MLESPIKLAVHMARGEAGLTNLGAAHSPGRAADKAVQWRVTQPARLVKEEGVDGTSRRATYEAAMEEDAESPRLLMAVRGTWLYDTEFKIHVRLIALQDVSLRDVSLHVPFRKALAKYLMGFERHGRLIQKHVPLKWQWKKATGANLVWIGDVHAGMRLKLTGEGISWDSPMHRVLEGELSTLSWHNHGLGSVRVTKEAAVHARTGFVTLHVGGQSDFHFELLLTPNQPLRPRLTRHWHERYTQIGYPSATMPPPPKLAQQGSNVLNYHQVRAQVVLTYCRSCAPCLSASP